MPSDTVKARLLKRVEAAARMGLEPQTLANWQSQGKGPPVIKFGHTVRYDERDLERFIDAARTENRTAN